jgi:hypothetical protein
MKNVETKLPVGRIVEIKELPDGSYKVIQEVADEKVAELNASTVVENNNFILVEAECLSLDDKFMQYIPKTTEEKKTMDLISEAILGGVKNFYRPRMDPSFSASGIDYRIGVKPAIGRSYSWWDNAAKNYCPERGSRLGTRLEYAAFLGVLIKKLIDTGKTVEWAWNAVCNDSKELGHYADSKGIKGDFESTGSRFICGFYDLSNVPKLLKSSFYYIQVSGMFSSPGHYSPIARMLEDYFGNLERMDSNYVGWIVLS